jgi:hypothetical protein
VGVEAAPSALWAGDVAAAAPPSAAAAATAAEVGDGAASRREAVLVFVVGSVANPACR